MRTGEGLALLLVIGLVGTFGFLMFAGLQSGYINNRVVLRDGTNPLTDNWNAGNYNITADWFNGNFDGSYNISENLDASGYNITADWFKGNLDESLVLWLPMDEGTGNTTLDYSGYDNTGDLGNSTEGDIYEPTWVNSKFYQGLSYDGDEDYVEVSTGLQFGTGDFSVILWIKPSRLGQAGYIASKGIAWNNDWWLLYQHSNNRLLFKTYDISPNKMATSTTSVELGEWYLIGGVREGDKIYIYVNGVQEDYANITTEDSFSGTYPLTIGVSSRYHGNPYKGETDDFKTFSRALSPKEMAEYYRQKAPSIAQGGSVDGDLDLSHNYILNMDYTHMTHFSMTQGVTDIEINVVPVGFWTQDHHFHKLGFSVDTAPGAGKWSNCTITDGTNELTVSLTGAETSGISSNPEFDLDVSVETFTIHYSQTGGGSSEKGMTVMLYHYKENE